MPFEFNRHIDFIMAAEELYEFLNTEQSFRKGKGSGQTCSIYRPVSETDPHAVVQFHAIERTFISDQRFFYLLVLFPIFACHGSVLKKIYRQLI